MVTRDDVELLNELGKELETLVFDCNDDDDYEKLENRIYDIENMIRSITDYWESECE